MDERKAIDVVRTFSNYAIVLMHACAARQYVLRGTWENRVWDFVCTAVTSAVLPGLFVISGYLLARGFSASTRWEKLVRRVKRLLIPYLAWNATFVVFYLAVCKFVPRMGERVSSFGLGTWQGALGKIASFTIAPLDMPTWFMRTLFVYSILAFIIIPLLKQRKGLLAYGLLGGWFALSLVLGWGGRLRFTYPFYSLLCFVIGMHLQVAGKSPFGVFKSSWWVPIAVIGMCGLFWHNIRWHWGYSPVRDVSFMLMAPFVFSVASWWCRMADRVPCWDFVRKSSFFLYTGHFFFCSIVLHALAPFMGWWTLPGKLTFLIVVFCTLGVAVNLAAYWTGKRFLSRFFGVWDGTL